MAKKKRRSSPRVLAAQADRILEEARQREKQLRRRRMSVVTLSREELIRKLSGKTAHSPFFTQVGWGAAKRGSNFPWSFGIMNPDPWPYSSANLALCYGWSQAGCLAEPGLAVLAARAPLGVRQVDLGVLNTSASPYYVSADHVIPTSFPLGFAELTYFLYAPDAFSAGVLLERGCLVINIT